MIALISHLGVPYIPRAEFLEKHFNFLADNKIKYFSSFYIWRYKRKGVRTAYDAAKFSSGERMVARTIRRFCLLTDFIQTEKDHTIVKEFFQFVGYFTALLAITFFENIFNYRASGGLGWSKVSLSDYSVNHSESVPVSVKELIRNLTRQADDQKVKLNFDIEYIGSDPLLWVEYSKRGTKPRKKCVAIWNGDTVILP